MGLIVDSNIFIDAENRRLALNSIPSMQTEPVFIAAITVSELLAGVKLAKTPEEHIRRHSFVENIINTLPVLDFDAEVARTYAELYAFALKQTQRSKMNVHDLQIAATALVYGYSVLSANVGDFKNIPGVNVISPYESGSIHEAISTYGKINTPSGI